MEFDWQGAVVEGVGEGPPAPDSWEAVEIPGRPSQFAGAERVAYRTRFADPRDADVERGLVTIRDVYASATVYLNGQQLVRGDWAAPIRAPFSPMAENELVVVCEAPADRFGGIEDTDAVPARTRVPSIRGAVDVEAVPSVYVHDLTVSGDTGGEESTIELSALIDAAKPIDDRLTLSLRPEGFRGGGAMERTQVQADAGERVRVQGSLQVQDERRWWPRELGEQPRYTVRAKLEAHERSATTGLVAVEREGGDLLLNGQRHRPRGVSVPPTADPDVVIEEAIAANATLVRARGHVPPERLAEACDEAGLLYWQDLPLVGAGGSGPGGSGSAGRGSGRAGIDVERGRSLARALAASRSNHPSLVCWGVHADPVDPFGGVGSGPLEKLKFRWRAWRAGYDAADAEALAGSLPSDAVVLPVTGPPGIGADAAHVYPGWKYLDATDLAWLREHYPEVDEIVGGFGAGSLARPGDGTAARIDREALSAATAEDPGASQREQARTVRTVLDALRRAGVGTIVLDSLLDADLAGGMGVVDAEGERKPAFQGVASGFQPLQAVLDGPPTGGEVGVTVCNDTATERSGTLAWTAGERTGSSDVSVDAFGRAAAGVVDVPGTADRLTLEYRIDAGTVTNSYDLTIW